MRWRGVEGGRGVSEDMLDSCMCGNFVHIISLWREDEGGESV